MAQFNSLLVTGNSRFLNPINGNARNGIYYVKGTQTAATGAWTGSIPVPALYDGLTIMYYLPYAGSGNATLNLTLSDGTTTGAKNCYYSTGRLTTHYSAGQNVVMTYHPAGAISVNGTATSDDRWIVTADYNSDYVLPYTWTSGGTAEKYISGGYLYIDLGKQWFMFNLIYANTYAGALTLNVNGTGAKPLYINGTVSSSSNHTMPRGTYLTYYDGTNYYVRTDGKITASITGDAATVGGHTVAKDVPSNAVFTDNNTTYTLSTSGNNVVLTPSSGSANTITVPYATNSGTVNGHTVAKDVPSNAVFTDNNTTYTFANGTNGFTVTPSGGSAQTVTVTPSISNNVTGSGTSGYLTKFNGANTITNGPALGSDTTKFLRNDGTWASPAAGSDVNVTQTATSTSANYEVLFSGTADNTTRTEGARKNNNLTFNPSTGNLQATQLNGVNVGNSPAFTDTKVMQTGDSATNADFPVLFAGTADATTRTEGAKKSARIVYNPYSSFLRFKGSNGISYTDISTGQIALSATSGETGETNIHTLITPDAITLGNHDSEDPYLVLYATSEGGVVIAHQIVCNTILVSDISEDYIPSKTSGNWSIGSDDGIYRIKAYRMGNLVQMSIAFHGNGNAVASGNNGFVGNISGGPLPAQQVTLTGFYSSSILAATLDTDGSLTVRPFSASCTLSNASRAYLTGTFMFE